MMNRKAQSALEFLTTYGWAFLIILIMIGALAYFGILSPSRLLPNRCNFGSEWGCVDYQVASGTSTVRLRLKNNLGEPITINNIAVGTEGTTSLFCTTTTPIPPITSIRSGEARDITFTVCGLAAAGILQGEKAKINVTIDYYSVTSGINYMKQTKGDMYVGVI
ncbi:MAG: hypothetical protein AABX00_04530 [Nanoarchaeota archaeon]|mgnify:CR=1 FL=1